MFDVFKLIGRTQNLSSIGLCGMFSRFGLLHLFGCLRSFRRFVEGLFKRGFLFGRNRLVKHLNESCIHDKIDEVAPQNTELHFASARKIFGESRHPLHERQSVDANEIALDDNRLNGREFSCRIQRSDQ